MEHIEINQSERERGTADTPEEHYHSMRDGTLMSDSSSSTSSVGGALGRRVTGALAAGRLLSGRYCVVQLMGKGGFGAVYQAHDERFEAVRVVAIKEMSDAHLSPDERTQALKDFRQEANLLVQFTHPNLPAVSDFFEEGGKAYLVMEFVEGKSLERVQEEEKGPLDEALVMGWAVQFCAVLHYLHMRPQPIIFRDMKPSNVMVTTDNQIKLIDFGIARIFKPSVSRDTTLLGSQGYAPLEQYGRGQSDPRADIYALGATLYDLLTRSLPADAPSRRVQPQMFVPPRQLNPRLSLATEAIILRAMEQDPQERFQSAQEMQRAILASGRAPANAGAYPGGAFPAVAASTPTLQRQAPPPVAPPPETVTPARTTFEREVLPLVVDIGSSIYRAIKEQSAGTQARRRNAAVMGPPPVYASPPAPPVKPTPAPPPAAALSHASWTRPLFEGIGALFAGVMAFIYQILGVASSIISLLLLARLVLTFFQFSLGEFSSWVTLLSTPLVTPFGRWLIFYPTASSPSGYTLDGSTLIALVVYAIGFALLGRLFKPCIRKQKQR
jgi:serine/threonine protein kinase